MIDWNPIVVKGHHIIQLLKSVRIDTLKEIRKDLGDQTFANCDLIKIVERATDFRTQQLFEAMDTVTIDDPDYIDD